MGGSPDEPTHIEDLWSNDDDDHAAETMIDEVGTVQQLDALIHNKERLATMVKQLDTQQRTLQQEGPVMPQISHYMPHITFHAAQTTCHDRQQTITTWHVPQITSNNTVSSFQWKRGSSHIISSCMRAYIIMSLRTVIECRLIPSHSATVDTCLIPSHSGYTGA